MQIVPQGPEIDEIQIRDEGSSTEFLSSALNKEEPSISKQVIFEKTEEDDIQSLKKPLFRLLDDNETNELTGNVE